MLFSVVISVGTYLLPNLDINAFTSIHIHSIIVSSFKLQNYSLVSGGQKSRVAFAKITFKKPHIILLDEPSNHLVSRLMCIT